MMLSKIFWFLGTKGQKGERGGGESNHQTTQLPNHQTRVSHTEARRHGEEREMNFQHQTNQRSNHHTSTYGRMPMDAANGLTVKRSNGQTVLRGRRFAAPWARAAAVAVVAGGCGWGCWEAD